MVSKIVIKIWLIVKTYSRICAPLILRVIAGASATPTQEAVDTATRNMALSLLNFAKAFTDLGNQAGNVTESEREWW